ncbi:hypothetical protein AAHH79_35790, partial [Burkholderia pseudomallei]
TPPTHANLPLLPELPIIATIFKHLMSQQNANPHMFIEQPTLVAPIAKNATCLGSSDDAADEAGAV